MNDKDILEKAIHKAIENGWDIMDKYEANKIDIQEDVFTGNYVVAFLTEADAKEILQRTFYWEQILFDHEFAEALWSTEQKYPFLDYTIDMRGENNCQSTLLNWQHHLQQLATSEDRIKYLGDNI